jgi:hypothetical protein
MLDQCMTLDHIYLTWSICSNLSRVIDSIGQSHCSWEKCLPTQFTSRRLIDLWVRTQFLSRANQWSSGESQTSVDSRLLGLPGPYHQHVIGTFNICSRGPTQRSLTDIGGGYSLGGAGFPHTTPRPSQPVVSNFHLRALPGHQFNQELPNKPKFEFNDPMIATWSFNHLIIYHGLHLHLAIANKLSLAIGFTRIDRKVILIQLGYPSNSYNLMHTQES